MRNLWTLFAILSFVALVGSAAGKGKPKAPKERKDPEADDRALDERTRLGDPIAYGKLTLLPIVAREVKDRRDYLVLDEAFEKKLIAIRERDDETVNQLHIENKSDRPLFVMSGEVILGGKQDRIIGKDTIVPPKETGTIAVYCVEHGRWSEEEGSREFRSGKALAHVSLRNQANFEDQQDVWNEVAKKNDERGTTNDTDTYRRVTTDKTTDKEVKPYLDHFAAALAKADGADKIVGFAVVLNGEVVGIEAFNSPRLFAKLQPKLLRSYVLEAVDAPEPRDAAAARRVPTAKDVQEFQARAAKAEEKVVVDGKRSKTKQFKDSAAGVAGSEVIDAAEPDAGGAPVYKGVYKH